VHPYFLWFTVFVGLNLFQSALSGWCPMMSILRRAGVPDCGKPERPANTGRPITVRS
jgi:hypothetical protein